MLSDFLITKYLIEKLLKNYWQLYKDFAGTGITIGYPSGKENITIQTS